MAAAGLRNFAWLWLTAVIFLLDQASKYWALQALFPYEPQAVLAFFDWTLAFNTGAAFSLLSSSGVGDWRVLFLVTIAVLASILIMSWLYQLKPAERWSAVALASLLGGALGNLSDRLFRGYVVDFISLHINHTYYWPIFNVADIAICLGAGLYIFLLLFSKRV